jgi:CheY-like chemotaxis protein
MDGITAAEEIHRRFHLPVIFLTAYSEDATLARAKIAEPYGRRHPESGLLPFRKPE